MTQYIRSLLRSSHLLSLLHQIFSWYQSHSSSDITRYSMADHLPVAPMSAGKIRHEAAVCAKSDASAADLSLITTSAIAGSGAPIISLLASATTSRKLTRDDFLLWKTQILPVNNGWSLAHHHENDPSEFSIIRPDGTFKADPAYEKWWQQDQRVLGFINTLWRVVGQKNSTEVWEALAKNYSSRNFMKNLELQRTRVRLPSSGTGISRYRHPLTDIQYPIPSSSSGWRVSDYCGVLVRYWMLTVPIWYRMTGIALIRRRRQRKRFVTLNGINRLCTSKKSDYCFVIFLAKP